MNQVSEKTPSGSLDAAVASARKLAQQGHFTKALQCLEKISVADRNTAALYVMAVCHRKLNQRNKALQVLSELTTLDPDHARAYQEIGNVHVAARNAAKAIEGFEAAVDVNPALTESWRALVALYEMSDQADKLSHARSQLAQLELLPHELQAVKSYLNEGNTEMADTVCRHFLQQHKQHIEGMRMLAEIANRQRIIDDAEFILESAVAFEPKHIGARVDYATILLKRQRFEKANEVALALTKEHPDNKQFTGLLAATELGLGNTDVAIDLFGSLVAAGNNLQHALLSLGHAYKTAGEFDKAVDTYQQLYRHKPDYGDAFWSLANTKTYRFTDAEIRHMEEYSARPDTGDEDRVHLHFALGKAYEDREEFDLAFDHYERGNRLHKDALKYRLPAIDKRIARQKKVCTAGFFKRKESVGHPAADPIFIVGLPRAGSTLLEQILASHSKVDGTLELPNILSLSRRLRGRGTHGPDDEPRYPHILTDLDDDYFRRFGEQYIDDTRVFRQGAPYFIDKMPNNFVHIGLIRLILPNAKIIDARRHPMSCCFSGFKQLFAEGQEFTYSLDDIGNYYRCYVELMNHWDEVLPGFVLRVQHEDVVHDLETQVRRMLDFCGLPFEQSCVDFHKTDRIVRTPSSEQVRQPIYTDALQQWRHFEKHLAPLVKALGPQLLAD